jgi:hypothetical protein
VSPSRVGGTSAGPTMFVGRPWVTGAADAHRRGSQRVRRVSRWRDPPRSAADGPAASPRAGTLSGEAGRGRSRPRPPRPWAHDRACRLDSNRNWDLGIFSVHTSDTYQTTQLATQGVKRTENTKWTGT